MIALILIGWLGTSGVFEVGASSEPAGTTKGLSRFEFAETHMGSTFNLVLYSTGEAIARDASRAVFQRIAQLDSILSDYQTESELSRLSARAGGPQVKVSDDLFEILSQSKRFWELSEGAFDVTIGPVGRLWRRARREGRLPDPMLLAEALKVVGSKHLILNPSNKSVRLETAGMKLDLGGIAKGYASQAAVDLLKARGIPRALVAGAGDIVVGDAPPDAKGWVVSIAPLDQSKSEKAHSALLTNCAISTSGDAERFVMIDGKRYSHIVNPKTGIGVIDRASVTVIAKDGATADALSTAVFLLGAEKGLKLIESIPGAALFDVRALPTGIRTTVSSRFRQWLEPQ